MNDETAMPPFWLPSHSREGLKELFEKFDGHYVVIHAGGTVLQRLELLNDARKLGWDFVVCDRPFYYFRWVGV
jgi:hypothetical protein